MIVVPQYHPPTFCQSHNISSTTVITVPFSSYCEHTLHTRASDKIMGFKVFLAAEVGMGSGFLLFSQMSFCGMEQSSSDALMLQGRFDIKSVELHFSCAGDRIIQKNYLDSPDILLLPSHSFPFYLKPSQNAPTPPLLPLHSPAGTGVASHPQILACCNSLAQ